MTALSRFMARPYIASAFSRLKPAASCTPHSFAAASFTCCSSSVTNELGARLKALGVSYVLDHPGSQLYREDPGYYDHRTLALMAETLRRHGRAVMARDGLILYELL